MLKKILILGVVAYVGKKIVDEVGTIVKAVKGLTRIDKDVKTFKEAKEGEIVVIRSEDDDNEVNVYQKINGRIKHLVN